MVGLGGGVVVSLLALLALRFELPGLAQAAFFLSYPGIRLGRVWTDSGLPPHGEGAFAIIFAGIVLQWCVVGALLGLCWRMRSKSASS